MLSFTSDSNRSLHTPTLHCSLQWMGGFPTHWFLVWTNNSNSKLTSSNQDTPFNFLPMTFITRQTTMQCFVMIEIDLPVGLAGAGRLTLIYKIKLKQLLPCKVYMCCVRDAKMRWGEVRVKEASQIGVWRLSGGRGGERERPGLGNISEELQQGGLVISSQ